VLRRRRDVRSAAARQQEQQQQQQPVQLDTVTQGAFQEVDYEATAQGRLRRAWAASVRQSTGRQCHEAWAPQLDPPLLLDAVSVVLVGVKQPVSCGTIARACSCFEVQDLRLVQPQCDHNSRCVD
jgi:tRNA G18 (ribose-2'-O)-methylase SpoU